MGVAPDRLAKQLAENGQLRFAAAEVLRGKAMNLIAERVKVTDKSGHEVDIKAALNAPLLPSEADDAEDAEAADADAEDAEAADEAEVLAATETDAPAEPSEADAEASDAEDSAKA